MKRRPNPEPPTFNRQELRNPGLKRMLDAYAKQLQASPTAKASGLTETQYVLAVRHVLNKQADSRALDAFEKARVELTPVLSRPESDKRLDDLQLIWSLPEMQDMWKEIDVAIAAGLRPGPKPDYTCAKATMTLVGMGGLGPYAKNSHAVLGHSPQLRQMFQSLQDIADGVAAPRPGLEPDRSRELAMRDYTNVTRHFDLIADQVSEVASRTRIQLLLSLKEFHPRTGEMWLIDGTDVPAWVPQHGTREGTGSDADKAVRGRSPEAGYRAYTRGMGAGGKAPIGSDAKAEPLVRNNLIKAWRGYFLTALVDQATGLAGPITMFDATLDEAPSIQELFYLLYGAAEHYGLEVGAKTVVGDSAWDEDAWCEFVSVFFGVDPIFRWRKQPEKHLPKQSKIRTLGPRGELICRHGNELGHGSFEKPSRAGVLLGDATPEGEFRLRAKQSADCDCGKPGLRAMEDWSRILKYPHHGGGAPHLHGFREAALACLPQIESLWSSLKGAHHLATSGAARTRMTDIKVVRAFIELALLGQVALTVYDQRQRHGQLGGAGAAAGPADRPLAMTT